MATTTNFGWETPDDTDLVKDGAAAMRTLGNSIDSSFVDLKGGTTNQILAKNSNSDLDFKWVSDATGMTNPMTTTGDTIYSSSGSTPARLGIGTAGQVLAVNSGATAPEWKTLSTTPTMYEERFDASTTWTVPTGVTKVWVTMIGGGGGGPGNSNAYWGEAGKHGEVIDQILSVTAGNSITVTIGAGGAGGTGSAQGSAGSQTDFGSLTALGGAGGPPSLWPQSDVYRGKMAESTPINGRVSTSLPNNGNGVAGTANTGSGGSSGKNSGQTANGGAGGSGFVFIRYVI